MVRASDGHSVDPAKDEGGAGGGVRGEVAKNELGFFAEGKFGSLREMVVALPSSVLAVRSFCTLFILIAFILYFSSKSWSFHA